jgi:hypothetical protein
MTIKKQTINKQKQSTVKQKQTTNKNKQFAALKESLNIDEKLTKAPNKRTRLYNKVKDNIPMIEDYNFQADLLFLPITKLKYRYLLTMVDLATDEIDFQEIKDKEPSTILKAMKTIFKRPYLNEPYASIRTDAGNEFKGIFQKYLHEEGILLKTALTGRHRQTANIENVNKILGGLLSGYMASFELKTGKPYKEWADTKILNTIRVELNKIKKRELPKNPTYSTFEPDALPIYKKNDMVYRLLDEPRNALNEKQIGKFREYDVRYDQVPRMIKRVLYFAGNVSYRYLLEGINQASYAEWELKPTEDEIVEEVAEIKAILDRKYNRKEKKYYYLLWFYEELKKNAGWYERSALVNDIGLPAVEGLDNLYLDLQKEKAIKKKTTTKKK